MSENGTTTVTVEKSRLPPGELLNGTPVNSPQPSEHRKLPDVRRSVTHKFTIDGNHKGYITVGLYDDGVPGELFIVMAKEGSTVSGLMDVLATTTSMALQHGVSLKKIVEKWMNQRFEPSGFTQNPEIQLTKSIVDYLGRWLGMKFLTQDEKLALNLIAAKNGIEKDEMHSLSE